MFGLVGPEKVYVVTPAVAEDSFRSNVPSGVPPSGLPVVAPFSVTQRLMALPMGRPHALTTYVSPTSADAGLTAHPELAGRCEAAPMSPRGATSAPSPRIMTAVAAQPAVRERRGVGGSGGGSIQWLPSQNDIR